MKFPQKGYQTFDGRILDLRNHKVNILCIDNQIKVYINDQLWEVYTSNIPKLKKGK